MKFVCPNCGEKFSYFITSKHLAEQSEELVLDVLQENGECDWSTIEKETGLGPPTLSRRLKALIKEKKIQRRVSNEFPPKAYYKLRKNKDAEVSV